MDPAVLPPSPWLPLIKQLIAEIDTGYECGSTFREESWEYICRRMNIENYEGRNVYTVANLKRYTKILKGRYGDFSELLALDGVQWDKEHNKVRANNIVWRRYFQIRRYANNYFVRGEKHYDLLCRIFESGVKFE